MKRQLLVFPVVSLAFGGLGYLFSGDWGFVGIIVAGSFVAAIATGLKG